MHLFVTERKNPAMLAVLKHLVPFSITLSFRFTNEKWDVRRKHKSGQSGQGTRAPI